MTVKTPPYQSVKRDLVLLTLFLSLLFGAFLGTRPLSVPDEGRYTEIPRQMVETGDYVTPRLNGVKYFEKPPLIAWLTTTSIKAFGINEWALRFWPALFALFGCLATYLYGRRFYSRNVGIVSAIVLSSNLLYYAHSRILILDMPLAALLAISLFAFHTASFESNKQKQFWWLMLFFAASAAALLTKGLIGILLPGAIILLWVVWSKQYHALKLAFHPIGILIFTVLAVPWHILASLKTPEFFDFYIIHEQFLRFFSKVHHRVQPFWIFVPIVMLGLFPWVAFFWKSLVAARKDIQSKMDTNHSLKFLIVWAAFIFVFFSASQSKLIPYIVPIFPPLAILIGRVITKIWEEQSRELCKWPTRIFLGFSAILTLAIPSALYVRELIGHEVITPVAFICVTSLVLGMVATLYFSSKHNVRALILTMFTASMGVFIPLNSAWVHIEGRSIKTLTNLINKYSDPEDTVIAWQAYYQDLPVYTERRITVVNGFNELTFGTTIEDTTEWMINDQAFEGMLTSGKPLFIVMNQNKLEEFISRYDRAKNLHIVGRSARAILLTNKALSGE